MFFSEKFYKLHLKSEQWREIREKVLALDGYTCRKCGSTKNLNVHHRTYRRLGCENPEDLITWCELCHKKHHDAEKRRRERKQKKKKKKRPQVKKFFI